MSNDFRALCAELHAAVQLYTGQNPAAAGIPANELVARLMDAMANTAAALEAQPEPQGPPKNCWLDDDEPYLCPSPCVFDDPSEVIDDCVEARRLSIEGKPKEACKYYRTTAQPEPQGPSKHELFGLLIQAGGVTQCVSVEWLEPFADAVLARWGRPVVEPVLVSERLPGPEDCDAEGRCWWALHDGRYDHWKKVELMTALGGPWKPSHWLPHWALPAFGVEGGND